MNCSRSNACFGCCSMCYSRSLALLGQTRALSRMLRSYIRIHSPLGACSNQTKNIKNPNKLCFACNSLDDVFTNARIVALDTDGCFYRNQDSQAAASEREENHTHQLNNIQTQNGKSWNIIDS